MLVQLYVLAEIVIVSKAMSTVDRRRVTEIAKEIAGLFLEYFGGLIQIYILQPVGLCPLDQKENQPENDAHQAGKRNTKGEACGFAGCRHHLGRWSLAGRERGS